MGCNRFTIGVIVFLAIGQLGFRQGDEVEFTRDVSAHSSSDVRHDADNKLTVISAGTRAVVLGQIQHRHSLKAGAAVQVQVDQQIYWVYYNAKYPWLQANTNSGTATTIKEAHFFEGDLVVFTRDVNAHSNSDVRRVAENKILKDGKGVTAGTRATVLADQPYLGKNSRGEAVQVKALDGPFASSDHFWVYFSSQDPWMKLARNRKIAGESVESPQTQPEVTSAPDLTFSKNHDDKIEEMRHVSGSRYLSISPLTSYSAIHATDASGKLAIFPSSLNFGTSFKYEVGWSDHFHPYLSLGVESMTFSSLDQRSVNGSARWYSEFAFGAKIPVSSEESGLSFFIEGSDRQTPIAHAVSTQTLTLDSVSLISVTGGLSHVWIGPRNFGLLGQLEGSVIFPSNQDSYTTQTGYGGKATLEITDSLSRGLNLNLGPYYEYRSINESIGSQNIQELGVTLQLQFRFTSNSSPREEAK